MQILDHSFIPMPISSFSTFYIEKAGISEFANTYR